MLESREPCLENILEIEIICFQCVLNYLRTVVICAQCKILQENVIRIRTGRNRSQHNATIYVYLEFHFFFFRVKTNLRFFRMIPILQKEKFIKWSNFQDWNKICVYAKRDLDLNIFDNEIHPEKAQEPLRVEVYSKRHLIGGEDNG